MKHTIIFYTGFGLNTRQTTILIDERWTYNADAIALTAVHAACAALAVQPRELRLESDAVVWLEWKLIPDDMQPVGPTIAELIKSGFLADLEPPADLGRFNCAGRYVFAPDKRVRETHLPRPLTRNDLAQ